jgi:hypothetical protein
LLFLRIADSDGFETLNTDRFTLFFAWWLWHNYKAMNVDNYI